MREFVYGGVKPLKLSKFLGEKLPELSYRYFRVLLRTKDVKVNGKRTGEDVLLHGGDRVEVYADEAKLFQFSYTAVYEDDFVVLALKPRGMQSETFARLAARKDNLPYRLCHRLDTNTQGLLVLAKTPTAERAMLAAFKEGRVEKRYLALVGGEIAAPLKLKHFLLKDAEKGEVRIVDAPTKGALTVLTDVFPIEKREGATLVEILLHTGRTHQIRAHLAHIGHPVVGDPKYGDYELNRRYRAKFQLLTAYKIAFRFPADSPLSALDGRQFSISPDFR